jgi:hypothetical protein
MLYELRTCHAMPGRLPDLNRRFAKITLGFFRKHGIQVIGFWTNELRGSSDQLLYILVYDSLADREKKWGDSSPTRTAWPSFRRPRRTVRSSAGSPRRSSGPPPTRRCSRGVEPGVSVDAKHRVALEPAHARLPGQRHRRAQLAPEDVHRAGDPVRPVGGQTP